MEKEKTKKEHKWQVKYLIRINNETIVCQKKETAKLIAESLRKNNEVVFYSTAVV